MKLFVFKSIQTRLTFWFLLLTLIPLFIVLIITYFQRVKVIESDTFEKLTAIRDLKVERLNDWLSEMISDMKAMSENNDFSGMNSLIDKENYDKNDLIILDNYKNLLNAYVKNYSSYSEILILNPITGKVMISTDHHSVNKDKSDQEYFIESSKNGILAIKDIYYSKSLSSFTMTYSIPIITNKKSNEISGVLVAHTDLKNSLFRILSNRVGLGKTGETLIVNTDVVALNELRWHDNAPLNLKITAEPAVKASQGQTGITETTDYRDAKILAAYTFITQPGWGFVCKQDMHELNAPIRKMIFNFIIIFLVTGVLIVFVTMWMSQSISKPIFELDSVARKISSGDSSVRNKIISKDELGSLAIEFNKMADITESRLKIQQNVVNISENMIEKSSMKEFAQSLLEQLMKITGANMSTFYILNENTDQFDHFVSIGANKQMLSSFSSQNPEGEFGNAIILQKIFYLRDIPENTIFKFRTTAGDLIPKEIITLPILIDDIVVALISIINLKKFTHECYEIIKLSWININSFYSTLLGNERTRILAENLTKTLLQNEENSEELKKQTETLQTQSEELQQTSEELQEQNLKLEIQSKQLGEANRLKSEFLSNMSHELRTPLNSIMALSRVLVLQAKDKLSEEENNFLEIIERNGKQLLSLINNILDLSKIEAGKIEIVPSIVSLKSLLSNIRENLLPIVNEKDLDFELEINDDVPKIFTDEGKLRQVLQNIISNAVKFTEKGFIQIKVNFNAGNVIIDVIDSGIGIPEDSISSIFEEFRQLDGTSSKLFEGTGLGLAIANKLINNLGGSIKVNSKLGRGSIFSISLPVRYSIKSGNNPQINLRSSLNNFKNVKQKKRLLLAEDNRTTAIQMGNVLENEAYLVDIVTGGEEAIDYLRNTTPDGIILDLMMPDVDGFEVLRFIRNNDQTSNIPVMVLTARELTSKDLSFLIENNIQKLAQKGETSIESILNRIKQMLNMEVKIESSNRIDFRLKKRFKEKPEVLIVEDNLDNLITIKAMISNEYNLLEAINGVDGLYKILKKKPDIVLLDISLPRMDGLELIEIIKNSDEIKSIPIIAVTARAMKEDKETLLMAGFDDYLPKPINQKLLLKTIKKWLGI